MYENLRTISSRSSCLRVARREAAEHIDSVLSDDAVSVGNGAESELDAVLASIASEGVSDGWVSWGAATEVPARWRTLFLAALDKSTAALAAKCLAD